jgi:hypothetical protein
MSAVFLMAKAFWYQFTLTGIKVEWYVRMIDLDNIIIISLCMSKRMLIYLLEFCSVTNIKD